MYRELDLLLSSDVREERSLLSWPALLHQMTAADSVLETLCLKKFKKMYNVQNNIQVYCICFTKKYLKFVSSLLRRGVKTLT
jgi:hypothetical protein